MASRSWNVSSGTSNPTSTSVGGNAIEKIAHSIATRRIQLYWALPGDVAISWRVIVQIFIFITYVSSLGWAICFHFFGSFLYPAWGFKIYTLEHLTWCIIKIFAQVRMKNRYLKCRLLVEGKLRQDNVIKIFSHSRSSGHSNTASNSTMLSHRRLDCYLC